MNRQKKNINAKNIWEKTTINLTNLYDPLTI